jgi:hypothetical protein
MIGFCLWKLTLGNKRGGWRGVGVVRNEKNDVLLRSDHNVVLYVRLYLQKCKLGFTLTTSGSPSTVMIMGFRFGVMSEEYMGYVNPFVVLS